MSLDLTEGNITRRLWLFALPLMIGNLLQQLYNVADTLIVGRFLGADALAAVGSAYTLMVFLTSILLGLCMGSSAFFAMQFGKRDMERLKNSLFLSFLLIGAIAIVMNALVFIGLDWIVRVLHAPDTVASLMRQYLFYIFFGILATFLYNFFANLLRAVGNSLVPLAFLAASAVLNIALDLWFVLVCRWGGNRCSSRYGDCTVCFRHRHCCVLPSAVPGIAGGAPTHALGSHDHPRDRRSVRLDLRAAVGYEFRYFDGAGTGQQLR